MTKAERTIGTPGIGPAADEPADGQDADGRENGARETTAAAEPAGDGTGDGPAEPGTGPAAGETAAVDETVPAAGAAATDDLTADSTDDPAGAPTDDPTHDLAGAPADESLPAGDTAAADAVAARGKRRVPVLFGVAALAYLLDIVSKTIVVHHLEGHPPIRLLGQYLQLEAVRNSGAAFGIGQGMTIVFTLIALIVIGVIARLSRRLYSSPWAVALGLLLGGALGNLTDRIFRSPGIFQGAVVDFIAPQDFAVFNLADSAIVCGGVLIVWLSFRGLDPDGSVHRD